MVGKGYIRFVGGSFHNRHLYACWHIKLRLAVFDAVLAGSHSEQVAQFEDVRTELYELELMRTPDGCLFFEYHFAGDGV